MHTPVETKVEPSFLNAATNTMRSASTPPSKRCSQQTSPGHKSIQQLPHMNEHHYIHFACQKQTILSNKITPAHLQHNVAEAWAYCHILQQPLNVILHHVSTQHSISQHDMTPLDTLLHQLCTRSMMSSCTTITAHSTARHDNARYTAERILYSQHDCFQSMQDNTALLSGILASWFKSVLANLLVLAAHQDDDAEW